LVLIHKYKWFFKETALPDFQFMMWQLCLLHHQVIIRNLQSVEAP
jgi:hypothetical protein